MDKRSHFSFWHDSDETAIGNLDQLQLDHCPQIGDEIDFVADGLRDSVRMVVTRVRHTIIFQFQGDASLPFQQVDVFIKPAIVLQ